uniref:Pentatricopeptide repeat-containing protein At3g12770 family n=1 Tax=Cajanus cajan TaxID=3821 RepID=A0A151RI02_CAJCA|nr:Pentatricopeptide repeat-containing protein At3g12770 family [Cajanus cajan]
MRTLPHSFTSLLQSCKTLKQAKKLHALILLTASHHNPFFITKLTQIYADCDDLRSALALTLLRPNVFAFTAILYFHSRHAHAHQCILTYARLRQNAVVPDNYVFPKVLKACAKLSLFVTGTVIHKDVVAFGSESNVHVRNSLLGMYAKCGDMASAERVFGEMPQRDVFSWNSVMSGYVCNGLPDRAVEVFGVMKEECQPDVVTWNTLMDAYWKWFLGDLASGREIHGYGLKIMCGDVFYRSAGAALLTLYAGCGRVDRAYSVFRGMDKGDVVTWNAMIFGLVDAGLGHLALECFREMQGRGVEIDGTTVSTILPVCDLRRGKQLHAYVSKWNFSCGVPVFNALVHMYSIRGCIVYAHSVFSMMENKDLVSWNTIIGGYGTHGLGQTALKLLQEMSGSGIRPDLVTFSCALSACSHSGLVDEGIELFYRMTQDFGLIPVREHFSCVVDMLARAGRLEDAFDFINQMPQEPDKHVWGALLAACQEHQNVSVGKLAAEKLISLEPREAGHYVTLSNIYSRAGRWDDAARVRKMMDGHGLLKPSGLSLVGTGS